MNFNGFRATSDRHGVFCSDLRCEHINGLHIGCCGGVVVARQVSSDTRCDIDSDVAFKASSGRHDQCVDGGADRCEGPFGSIGDRDVGVCEAGDSFAEGEGVGDVAAGDVDYAIFVIGDGERGRCRV